MMGETASLPLPSATPAAAALATTAPAAGATAATSRAAAAGTAQETAGTFPATGAELLFDLLLGEQPEAAAVPLAGTLPAATRAAAGERQEEAPAADPLLAVLAQIPQATALPAEPVPATAAGATVAGATAAAAQPLTLAVQPAAGAENAAPALATTTLPASSPPAASAPDHDVPGARFPLSQQAFATQAAAAETPLPGFSPAAAERGIASIEAAAPAPLAALNAVQSLTGAQPPTAPAATIATPVLSQPADPAKGYDDGFSSHVAWLAGQRIGQAEIRVVPEHLGAIDIRLQLDGNNVRAEFHSTQPEVRQALEASLPRLRDMLGMHGLQLAHAGVGQGQGGQRQSGDGMPQPGHAGGPTLPDEAGSPLPPDFRRARSLLDVYA